MIQKFRVAIATLVCACIAALSLAPGAMADDMHYSHDPLRPVLSSSTSYSSLSGSPIVTPQVEPAHFTFECTYPAVVVQADVSGFAIGNCLEGTHIRRELKSAVYEGHYWDGGYVFGNFAACGWVQEDYSAQAGTVSEQLCGGNVTRATSTYQVADNNNSGSTGGCSWKINDDGVGRCTNGTLTTMSQACTAYGNFKPWASGQTPTDPLRTIAAGTSVRWRYVAKYPWVAGNDYMVMIRDDTVGGGTAATSTGYGNWVFVKSSCLSGLPGIRYL